MKKIALMLALMMLLPLFALAESEATLPTFEDAKALYNEGKYDEAFVIFQQLAEQGDDRSMNALGVCYANGHLPGGEADAQQTLAWLNKAIELGNVHAMYNLGLYHSRGLFTGEPDDEQSLAWYLKAAELGNDKAMHNLGIGYMEGRYTNGTPDPAAALAWHLKAAEADNAKSIGKVIDLYHEGVTAEDGTVLIAPDHAALLAFLEEKYAAGTTNTTVLSWLGWMLCGNTDACKADFPRALEVFTKGADLGNNYCMMRIAEMYRYGNLGQVDAETALQWYKKAHAAGHADASHKVINLYESGLTAEDGSVLFAPDHAALLAFLEEVYAQGTKDSYVLSWLGWMLCGNSDQGVCEADYPRALNVYREAADLGDSYSMAQIGRLYEHGKIGPADPVAAQAWYEKAIAAGSELAQQYLDALTGAAE